MRDGTCDLSVQSGLYREHLAPNEGAFLDFLVSVREKVDASFLAKKAEAEAENNPVAEETVEETVEAAETTEVTETTENESVEPKTEAPANEAPAEEPKAE